MKKPSTSLLPKSNLNWNLRDSFDRPQSNNKNGLKAVVIGGGTGAPVSIKTLLCMGFETCAVVAMADDGGSTGKLRDGGNVVPPGDIRKCLSAMAYDSDDLVTKAFRHRFGYVDDHALGNLIITALAGLSSFPQAIEVCQKMLNAQGDVYPSTLDLITLKARLKSGKEIDGQDAISHSEVPVEHAYIYPKDPKAYDPALGALKDADLIVLGPGSLFTSIIPNLLVPGIVEAIEQGRAKTLFVCSLADVQGETRTLACDELLQALLDHGMQGKLDAICIDKGCEIAESELNESELNESELSKTPKKETPKKPLLNDEIRSKIKKIVPKVIELEMTDPNFLTWHSPKALGEAVLEVLS